PPFSTRFPYTTLFRSPLRRPLRRRRRGTPAQRGADQGVDTCMSWLWVFVGFCLLIILHEAGHFVAAKATGMRVERFFLFFGPTRSEEHTSELQSPDHL